MKIGGSATKIWGLNEKLGVSNDNLGASNQKVGTLQRNGRNGRPLSLMLGFKGEKVLEFPNCYQLDKI